MQKQITLSPGVKQRVPFLISPLAEGSYNAKFDGLVGSFEAIILEQIGIVIAYVDDYINNTRPAGVGIIMDGDIVEYTDESGAARFDGVELGVHRFSIVSEEYIFPTGEVAILVRLGENKVVLMIEPA